MQMNLIRFSSILNNSEQIKPDSEKMFEVLRETFNLRILSPEEIDKVVQDELTILYIETGGVEHLIVDRFEQLPRPIILLANDKNNSLPSTLEISSWLRRQGVKFEFLYGTPDQIIRKLQLFVECFKIQRSLQGMKIGVIGAPSSWLISSGVDYLLTKRRWGVEYVDIPLEEVFARYSATTEKDVEEETAELMTRASISHECTLEKIIKAMRLYHALHDLCKENELKAITLSCFKILGKLSISGCLALSLLNDDGIISGCEGDLQALFSMILAKEITGIGSFMGNVSSIDKENNEVTIAHCTISTKLTDKFCLRSHLETNKSIAVQGWVSEKDITITRCGGECLDEYFLSSGKIIANTDLSYSCRTQLRIHMQSPVNYFLKNPLGNHHIVMPGDVSEKLNLLLQFFGCKRIE